MSFSLRPIDFRASLLEKPTQLYDCGSSLHISFHPIFLFVCLFCFLWNELIPWFENLSTYPSFFVIQLTPVNSSDS